MKENFSRRSQEKHVRGGPSVRSFDEVAIDYGQVHNLQAGKNGYQSSGLSFKSDLPLGAEFYEVLFYDSLDAPITAPEENFERVLLMPNLQNMQSSVWIKDERGANVLKDGFKRTQLNGTLRSDDALVLQALTESVLQIREGDESREVRLAPQEILNLARSSGREVQVSSGRVLRIDPKEKVPEQGLLEGMLIFEDELLQVQGLASVVNVETASGSRFLLDGDEGFRVQGLNDPSDPSAQLTMEDGSTITLMKTHYANGQTGTLSQNILLHPQLCADSSPPFAIVDGTTGNQIDLAILKTTTLSAESSFDSMSDIHSARWDTDGDGVDDSEGLQTLIGPYQEPGPQTVTLTLTDLAGNESQEEIQVNVYVPDLTLESATPTEVTGSSDPATPEFPFDLVRQRDGVIRTLRFGALTDEKGDILEDDFNNSPLIDVYNRDLDIVAQFDPFTKQVVVTMEGYEAEAFPAGQGWPTRIVVFESASEQVMASFVVSSSLDGSIDLSEEALEEKPVAEFQNQKNVLAHLTPALAAEKGLKVESGQITLKDNSGALVFALTADGNVIFYSEEVRLEKTPATSTDEFLVLQIYEGDRELLEFWPGHPAEAEIVNREDLDLPPGSLPGSQSSVDASGSVRFEFADISKDDPLYQDIYDLVERGVLQGYEKNGERVFEPDKSITRAEFTQIMLSILCIVPGEEAKNLPAVFNDVNNPQQWYYPVSKEAFLRGLVTGYGGEIDADGFTPFKPGNLISRAEGTKIILEALELQGVVDLKGETAGGSPWYEPYLRIGLDLSPYLKETPDGEGATYVLTRSEAVDPSHKLTRYEFVEMASRVLDFYNCFDLDSDGDGLGNFDEENRYGTDHYDPDTDDGGVNDGEEVGRGSNPLNPVDDFGSGLGEVGVFAIHETCSTCPCEATIDYDADLRPGDSVFTIIRNEAGKIFGVSNQLEVGE